MISSADAEGLIHKLVTEAIPVFACFTAADGSRCTLNGLVDRLTADGLIILGNKDPEHPDRFSLMQFPVDKTCEFGFSDKREIPLELDRDRLAATYGEAVLFIRFPSDSRLLIFFNG